MDWAALMDSEVMRNYLQSELSREAAIKPEIVVDDDRVVESFIDFEEQVQKNDKMRFVFQQLQTKFASDPEYARRCDPLFVQAVMILDIGEQE